MLSTQAARPSRLIRWPSDASANWRACPEDQLTRGGISRRRPLVAPIWGRLQQYTHRTIVETMSYEELDVSEQQNTAARSGVRHLEVEEAQDGQRLDNFIQRVLGEVPRSRIYRIIRKGEVRVNGHRAGPDTRLHTRDKVRIPPVHVLPRADPARPTPDALETVRQSIVYEDQRVLVLNKPAGMAVHGGSGLSYGVIEALRALKPEEKLELAHRLDRDTSGCLIVARNTDRKSVV